MKEAHPALLRLIKHFEGLHALGKDGLVRPYVCPAGYWTQGYGVLTDADAPPQTPEEAEEKLLAILPGYVADTLRLCPRLWLEPPTRLAAIADFTFNLGASRLRASTLRKRVNEGDWEAVEHELRKWVNGGGRRLPGLVARRAAEIRLIKGA